MFPDKYLDAHIPSGQRNDELFKTILMARERGWDEQDLEGIRQKAIDGGLTEGEVSKTFRSAMTRPVTPKSDTPKKFQKAYAMGWDDDFGARLEPKIDPDVTPGPAPNWYEEDAARYVQALFNEGEYVGFCAKAYIDGDGKSHPASAGQARPREDFIGQARPIAELMKANPQAGAWAKLNPMDGEGMKDQNVQEYRHTLLEFDEIPIDEQWRVVQQMNIPCSTVVFSGGHSLHFAVRVDAGRDIEEFRRRVAVLHKAVRNKGFEPDKRCKNPGRWSRIPGVWRGEQKQYLVATHIGVRDWDTWEKSLNPVPTLPSPTSCKRGFEGKYTSAPFLIEGLLREKKRFVLSSVSKGGKTFALIHMALALASGQDWLKFPIPSPRKVLFINTEIDEEEFMERIHIVSSALGITYADTDDRLHQITTTGEGNITIDLIREQVIRFCDRDNYDVIFLDPFYQVFEGDENSGEKVRAFCKVLDQIIKENNVAVVLSHHFTKGDSSAKNQIDRGSGSSVLARYPDAVGTLTPVPGVTAGFMMEFSLRSTATPPPVPLRFENCLYQFAPEILMEQNANNGHGKGRKGISFLIKCAKQHYNQVGTYPTLKDMSALAGISATKVGELIKDKGGTKIEVRNGLVELDSWGDE